MSDEIIVLITILAFVALITHIIILYKEIIPQNYDAGIHQGMIYAQQYYEVTGNFPVQKINDHFSGSEVYPEYSKENDREFIVSMGTEHFWYNLRDKAQKRILIEEYNDE